MLDFSPGVVFIESGAKAGCSHNNRMGDVYLFRIVFYQREMVW